MRKKSKSELLNLWAIKYVLPGNSPVIPGKNHARGYVKMEGTGELKDITYYNPSLANATGDMISNADDLNKFFHLYSVVSY